ncbi:MAG: transposase [Nitrospira sp.]|nr:MAG: transposase [Nitrospira sp.]
MPAGKKTACGACGRVHRAWYDRKIRRVRDRPCGDTRIYRELEIRRVGCKRCGKVTQEKLDWPAATPFDTTRFAFFVGRRCRSMTIKEVAEETRLDWKTIKDLDAQYMREPLRRAGQPAPKVVGIDEISIRKGHTGQRLGPATADLVRGQGPARHQGPEVHAALAPGEPDDRWPSEPEAVTEGHQATEHGLPPQGGVRAALGLRAGRRGSALLRALARLAQVAAPQAL